MKHSYSTKTYLLGLSLTFLISFPAFSQVGIGTDTPSSGSVLDISSDDKGVLVPRMDIEDLDDILPVTGGSTTSLLVYNTYAATGIGFYYWNGSKWIGIDSERDWKLEGNANTTPGTSTGENYLGTSDAQNLIIGTQGSERMRILDNGQVIINNTTAPSTAFRFTSYGNTNENAVSGYASGTGIGIYGYNSGSGTAVYGQSVSGNGVYGESSLALGSGVSGNNQHLTGTGVVGSGNDVDAYVLVDGSGGSFRGTKVGLAAWGDDTTDGIGVGAAGNGELVTTLGSGGAGGAFIGDHWGVTAISAISGGGATNSIDRAAFIGQYYSSDSNQETVYVGARIGNSHYKILGTGGGSVSTTMETSQGERILFAPESPENWFFDIGEVTLENGKAIVKLDKIFGEIIADSKPFKVFVQGSEGALGTIRITRYQKEKSFLVEDLGGPSNGTVIYSIYGIWKGKENLRFPEFKKEYIPKQVELSNKK